MALPSGPHRRGNGSSFASRGCQHTPRESTRAQSAFSAAHSLLPRSSRSGAARARAPLAVSAEAPKWTVIPPTKVNVRRPELPAPRAHARVVLRRRTLPGCRLRPPSRQRRVGR